MHAYSVPGLYTVTATAFDSTGQTGQTSIQISVLPTIIPPPLCLLPGQQTGAATPSSVTQPPLTVLNGPYRTIGTAPITVSAAGSTPETGQAITAYLLDFGDDPLHQFVTSTTPTANHSYAASGTYTVTVIVVSECQKLDQNGFPQFDAQGNLLLDITMASASTTALVDPSISNCLPPTGAGPFGPSTCGAVALTCSGPRAPACLAAGCTVVSPVSAQPARCVPSTTLCAGATFTGCSVPGCFAAAGVLCPPLTPCPNLGPAGCLPAGCVSGFGGCLPAGSCLPALLGPGCLVPPTCGVGQAAGQCSNATPCTGGATAGVCSTSCTSAALGPPIQAGACIQPSPLAATGINVNPGGPYQGQAGAPIVFGTTVSGAVATSVCTDGSNYGVPGLACTTAVTAADGSYLWDFGDGTTGNGPTPSHTYASAGTYTITLTFSLGAGGLYVVQTTASVT